MMPLEAEDVALLACTHRRLSALATIAHLRAHDAWGPRQLGSLLLGRCSRCA
jgi:hypothetical protein